jgi:hypothetical protein
MSDLILGAVLLYLISVAVFAAGVWVSASSSGLARTLSTGAAVLATVSFIVFLYGRLVMARILPLSNVIIVGNWIPLGVAWLAGVIWGFKTIPAWRRVAVDLALAGVAVYALLLPLLNIPPQARDTWTSTGVCLQSTPASCSACAAAMLLRRHGIDAGEREMMQLCLTGRNGTPQLGLYRGLKLKTRGTSHTVRAFHTSIDELLQSDDWPVVLLVYLDPEAQVDPRYEKEWGWEPGVGHAVTVFGRKGKDRFDVGDPSVGREPWSLQDLRVLWHGEGLRLVPR